MNKIGYILLGCLSIYFLISINKKTLIDKKIIEDSSIKDSIIRDSIIRDSIYIVNDSIVEKIKYIQKEHKETINVILSNSDSANLYFFNSYIEKYNNI